MCGDHRANQTRRRYTDDIAPLPGCRRPVHWRQGWKLLREEAPMQEERWLAEAIDDVLETIAAVTRNDAPPTPEERETVRGLFLRRLAGRPIDPGWEEVRRFGDR